MQYLIFLSLIVFTTIGCNDDSSEATCTFSHESRTYKAFERIDFSSNVPDEKIEIRLNPDFIVPINRDDIGTFIYAPPNNTTRLNVQVFDGEQVCSNLIIEVEPLSPKPEIVDQFMTALQRLNQELLIRINAISVPSAAELDDEISQAEFAAGLMNLRVSELQAHIDTLSAEDRGNLGGMLAVSGVAAMIQQLPYLATNPPNALYATTWERIPSPAELSRQMIYSSHFCTVARSDAAVIANAAILGATTSKHPVLGVAAASFALSTSLMFGNAALICATHPETLTTPKLNPNLDLEEDSEGWRAEEILVDAKSGPSVNLASLAVGLGLNAFSLSSALKGASEIITNFNRFENMFNAVRDIIALTEIKKATGETDFGGWEWKNINIASDEWMTVIPTGDVFVQQPCDTLCLKPLKVGSERVVFVPKIDKFPYSTPELDIIRTVHPITINIGPPAIPVEPNQNLVFDYGIDWALDRNMEWTESTQATPEAIIDSTDLEVGFMGYVTPADTTAYPVAIKATSLSIGGLRAPENSPEPRYDRTLLVLDELIAGPDGTCISPGEKKELFAIASSKAGEKATIEWAPATLVQNGVFTAPATPGNYTLTATARYATQASISEEIVVNVGDCGCWISVNGSILNARHDFDMTNAWTIGGGGTGVISVIIDGRPLVVSLSTPISEMPEGSFLSGVSISTDDGIWGSDAINTRINYESDGVHYQGLIAGVFMDGDKTGYASISFRGVRPLSSQACKSRTLYDGSLPSLIKDVTETP